MLSTKKYSEKKFKKKEKMICFFILIGILGSSSAHNTSAEFDDEIIIDLEFFKITNITKEPSLVISTKSINAISKHIDIQSFVDLIKKYFQSVLIFCLIVLVIFFIYLSFCLLCRSISDSESIYEKFSENRARDQGFGDLSIQEGDQSIVATSIRLLNENQNQNEPHEQMPKKKRKLLKFFKKESQRKLINESVNYENTQL